MISRLGDNCSIFSSTHTNLVGFRTPPYVPPMWLRATALSTKVSPNALRYCNYKKEVKLTVYSKKLVLPVDRRLDLQAEDFIDEELWICSFSVISHLLPQRSKF